MTRIPAASDTANAAFALVSGLQQRFVRGLEALARDLGDEQGFSEVAWLRDGGSHGGGVRFETADGPWFGRGSVNVSQVHYDDMPDKRLGSANAISTIIHPVHPLAPSVHIHVSWTELKDGSGYWRIMADLNPSHENPAHTERFLAALKAAAPAQFDAAKAQGERYFYIPVLGRHRGVAHFYLEGYHSGDADADATLARSVGETAIDTYLAILADSLTDAPVASPAQREVQLAYHTLYFFQVLTLDRGTTTGLLIHDQNDVGIMGSLPPFVDRALLSSWIGSMPAPQDALLQGLIDALPAADPAPVDLATKRQLADTLRRHYADHPAAIALQAAADVPPPTVQNHSD